MTECNKDCANYKPIEKPEPSAKQPYFSCIKCGKPTLYDIHLGLTYCPECAKLAKLNAQAPAGIPSPSLDELAEQQGINPVRTPADIPTLEIDEPDMSPAQEMIQRECRDIEAVLLDKNKAYGNSALDPVRIFSTADPIEQIRVRIDDKLSRIKRGQALGEDVTRDLIGYLILLRVAEKMKGSNCQ